MANSDSRASITQRAAEADEALEADPLFEEDDGLDPPEGEAEVTMPGTFIRPKENGGGEREAQ